ncbi:hypothetical protein L798_01201 [Zootermopsis nevadensis]|uniref:Uncharacterized protein n=1 Tax=Zootermopsis nevadensis TaxID=136037 RepID=A0A067QTH6_ZOONE|nr:hypothetical protein L798_01201 [Zootermopsis nevadensis]
MMLLIWELRPAIFNIETRYEKSAHSPGVLIIPFAYFICFAGRDCLITPVCLPFRNEFRNSSWVFIKIDMNVKPLELSQLCIFKYRTIIDISMATMRTSEVWPTLA